MSIKITLNSLSTLKTIFSFLASEQSAISHYWMCTHLITVTNVILDIFILLHIFTVTPKANLHTKKNTVQTNGAMLHHGEKLAVKTLCSLLFLPMNF